MLYVFVKHKIFPDYRNQSYCLIVNNNLGENMFCRSPIVFVREIWICVREMSGKCQEILFFPFCMNPACYTKNKTTVEYLNALTIVNFPLGCICFCTRSVDSIVSKGVLRILSPMWKTKPSRLEWNCCNKKNNKKKKHMGGWMDSSVGICETCMQ